MFQSIPPLGLRLIASTYAVRHFQQAMLKIGNYPIAIDLVLVIRNRGAIVFIVYDLIDQFL